MLTRVASSLRGIRAMHTSAVVRKKMLMATFDQLPIPYKPFESSYRKENYIFNRILTVGVVAFVSSCGLMYAYDLLGIEPLLAPKSYRNRVVHRD
uniref:Deltameth_res domain-containing protein n=1 Tax=Trichuris muris TaxID=70415 RepID=A0A5S6QQ96_TRIMR